MRVRGVLALMLVLSGLAVMVAAWAHPVLAANPCSVTNTLDDSNIGSLRAAINAVDAGTCSTITFAIPGTGPFVISIGAVSLPQLVKPVTIDGTSQSGFNALTGVPVIEITSSAPGTTNGLVLDNGSDGSTIKGLSVGGFIDSILIYTSNNSITGNYLGLTPSGTALANQFGVVVNSGTNNQIGGVTAASGNVISGNSEDGILIRTSSANTVEGNVIGTNPAGTAALGNLNGVELEAGATNNAVGGVSTGAGNLISGNTGDGVLIYGTGTTGNTVEGNTIGANIAGSQALGNDYGVVVEAGAATNTVGGTSAGAGNLIAGSLSDGVLIQNPGTTGNLVEGNTIGSASLTALANQYGVFIQDGAQNNSIGGTATGAGNLIGFNTRTGVAIGSGPTDATTTGNLVAGNAIHDNGMLGIDLGNDGVTVDAQTISGPNNLQHAPLLTSAIVAANQVQVAGTLTAAPSTSYRVELFSSTACDPSGYGEGATFLGYETVTTGANGTGTLSTLSGPTVSPGSAITATATDPSGNSSEFSNCVLSTGPATHFAISVPTSTQPGVPFQVTVTALDQAGNVVQGYLGTVHFTSSDLAAILPADYTFTLGDQGVHTFTVTLETEGAQTLTVTDTQNASVTGTVTVNGGECQVAAAINAAGTRLGLASVGDHNIAYITLQVGSNSLVVRRASIAPVVCAGIGQQSATATMQATLGPDTQIRGALFRRGDVLTVTVGNELVNGRLQPFADVTDTRGGTVVLTVHLHGSTNLSRVTIAAA